MSGSPEITQKNEDSVSGLGFAISAYFLWGFLPLYLKALSHISPVEVVVHRVVWSVPVAAAVLIALGRTKDIRIALTTPSMLAMACVTAVLVSINWGIYIFAIASGNALEGALGYYINPLFSVLLGAVLLGEKLARLQWIAIGFAAVAVLLLTIDAGRLPWIALALTISWGFYAFFKKSLPIGPNQGFLLEVLMLTPAAIAYWIYLERTGTSHFAADTWLLMGCGIVTAVPLILYANGAKRLRLTTIAVLQYIAPTMIFLVAVFVFNEPFGVARAIAFPLIWIGLVLYTLSMWRQRHG